VTTPRPQATWRLAALVVLVALLWACQDCPLLAVRVGALVVYVVGVTALAPSRATALAFAGLTAVGAGAWVLLTVLGVPYAGTVTGLTLAVVLALGSARAWSVGSGRPG
jgi:hypothetical protein